MTAKQILKARKIDPRQPIISLDAEDAIEKLLEFIEEWELPIKVTEITKQDWEKLLDSYGDSIITYHPENDHQERGAFLRNEEMLKKYGLADEDIRRLDFC